MKERQEILHAYRNCQRQAQHCAIATVVKTQGAVYRRPGARLLLTEDRRMIGAISGGCLEGDVFEQAQSIMQGGDPILVQYDTTSSDDIVWGLGLGCNGVVDVLIESLSDQTAQHVLAFIETQQIGAIATLFRVEGAPIARVGDRCIISQDITFNTIENAKLTSLITEDLQKVLTLKKSKVTSYRILNTTVEVLLEYIKPPIPLVIFGAGQDTLPVVQIARQLGWHITVCDHRPDYANRDRFPLANQILCCQPNDLINYPQLFTESTVVVIMTHHYLYDLELLKQYLPSRVHYIGLLGPKQRSQRLLHDLNATGFTPRNEQLSRLHNPIGLDIGTETPEEIALAIVAEIQAVLAQRQGGFLRDRNAPIHDPEEIKCLTLG